MKIFLLNKYLVDFFAAIMLFTRIPVKWSFFSTEPPDLTRASWSFPLIGLLVGILSGMLGDICIYLELPIFLSCVTAIIFSLIVTGAFHEDGLADVCDGFGGGFSPADKLRIMKDSRIGTYGATALWVVLSLRTAILAFLDPALGIVLLVVAHALSRIAPLVLIYLLNYVQDAEAARAKPVAQGVPSRGLLVGLAVIVPLGLWQLQLTVVAGLILVAAVLLLARLCVRQIGGYTGDYLGFSQQISEVLIYLSASGLWLST